MKTRKTHYDVLGVPQTASLGEIKQQYQKLALKVSSLTPLLRKKI